MTSSPHAPLPIDTDAEGPFSVSGTVVIRPMVPVVSERGEPMTWKPGDAEAHTDPVLCRCGQSSDKPFCDGSHAGADWDPADGELPDGTLEDRAERIETERLVLLDDPTLCMHAGFCGTAATDVWALMDEADDDTEARATVIRMVEKCPSGRLVNVVDDDQVEPSLPTEIGVVPGGPLWVTGGADVTSASGEALERRNRITLCRCGASSMKPLCDGSHKDIDFDD